MRCNVHLPSTWNSSTPSSSTGRSSSAAAGTSRGRETDEECDDHSEQEESVKKRKRKDSTAVCDIPVNSAGTVHHRQKEKLQPRGSAAEGCPPQSAKDACENILDAIQKCSSSIVGSSVQKDSCINLDHILSKVPYKDMLKDLFGCSTGMCASLQVPVVTKAYEESFMRQPMFEHERPCVMGADCECNFVSSVAGEGFVAVEFHLPSSSSSQQQQQMQMCVLCHRRMVQKLFYDIIYAGSPYRSVF
jgi:hypothetical protein